MTVTLRSSPGSLAPAARAATGARRRGSDDATGGVVAGHVVEVRHRDRLAVGRRLDDLPVADVDGYVADRAVEEHQVTGLEVGPVHGHAERRLHARRVRKAHPGRGV